MTRWRTSTSTPRAAVVPAPIVTGFPDRQLPAWQVRLVKLARRARQRIRWLLRIRRGVMVNGLWYKETSAIPLSKALLPPPGGPGFKEYRITFPDGTKQLVRATATDVFADLMGSVGLEHYYKVAHLLRPGMRVLEIGAGTGYRAAWLSLMVGPSGAVVAIGQKRELADYAQRRYPRPNIAFEVGSSQTLVGEIDGAFDCVFLSGVLEATDDSSGIVHELWRVLKPGGAMIAHLSIAEAGALGSGGDPRVEPKPAPEIKALEQMLQHASLVAAEAGATGTGREGGRSPIRISVVSEPGSVVGAVAGGGGGGGVLLVIAEKPDPLS